MRSSSKAQSVDLNRRMASEASLANADDDHVANGCTWLSVCAIHSVGAWPCLQQLVIADELAATIDILGRVVGSRKEQYVQASSFESSGRPPSLASETASVERLHTLFVQCFRLVLVTDPANVAQSQQLYRVRFGYE
jgi:hypothetical protein